MASNDASDAEKATTPGSSPSTESTSSTPKLRRRKTNAEIKEWRIAAAGRLRSAGEDEGFEAKQELKRRAVIKEVLDADTLKEVIHIAGALPPEWLLDADDLKGNLYRSWAFGNISFQKSSEFHHLRDVSCVLMFLCQLIAPLAILDGCLFGFVHMNVSYDFENFFPSVAEWRENAGPNTLRMIFLIAFWVNGYVGISLFADEWARVHRLYEFLPKAHDGFAKFSLYLGAFMRVWMVFWCCSLTFFVVARFTTSLDVLYDAVGLLFLYSLDSIGGDLVLVSDDVWPAAGLGWIEENIDKFDNLEQAEKHKQIKAPGAIMNMFLVCRVYCLLGTLLVPILHFMTPWHLLALE